MPTPRVLSLDVCFRYDSNSTSNTFFSHHSWDASDTYPDVYGHHANWIDFYSEASTNSSGSFADFMYERTRSTYIQWSEIEVFSNGTWTILLDMILPSIADVSILFKGDNTSITGVLSLITDGRTTSIFQDGLDSFGIEGLDISADISIQIGHKEVAKWFNDRGLDLSVPIDLTGSFQGIMFGTIPDDSYS
jgi:hypothetical protein